jgi:FtsH-binding integral membrane protein
MGLGGNVLYGGAPHFVAAGYAIVGWYMVLMGTWLGLISASRAAAGEWAALLPLPLVVVTFAIGIYSTREAARTIRSVMR